MPPPPPSPPLHPAHTHIPPTRSGGCKSGVSMASAHPSDPMIPCSLATSTLSLRMRANTAYAPSPTVSTIMPHLHSHPVLQDQGAAVRSWCGFCPPRWELASCFPMCSTDFVVQASFHMASLEQVSEWASVVTFAYMWPVSTHLHHAGVLGVPHWWFH
jgi:hypothetical protein